MEPDVPLVIPEVNPEHLELIETQQKNRGWDGFIVTNPNCSTIALTLTLKPLYDQFNIKRVYVSTMGGSVTTATVFTPNYSKIVDNWQKAPQGSFRVEPITLYLTVPLGTNPGSYQTTVYFSAVKHNAGAPTTP